MNLKTSKSILLGLALAGMFIVGFWCAYVPCNSIPPQTEQLIEVKIIYAHRHGDTIKERGFWNEPSTYAIYEKTDTGERFISCQVLGKAGDVLKTKKSDLNVTCG